MTLRRGKDLAIRILSLAIVVGIWEVTARIAGLGDTYPGPSTVFPLLFKMTASGAVFGPLGSTLGRTVLGFLLGFTIGLVYGVLVEAFPRFGAYSRGVFTALLFTPTLIIIFLGLIMIGRTNLSMVIIVGLAICTEVGVYMRDAFGNFDRSLEGMANSYQVSFASRTAGMYVPFLTPAILATTRIGFTLAWKVTFLGEVFGFPEGLGWNVRLSYQSYNIPQLIAWLIVFIVVLLLVEQLIRLAEWAVVRW